MPVQGQGNEILRMPGAGGASNGTTPGVNAAAVPGAVPGSLGVAGQVTNNPYTPPAASAPGLVAPGTVPTTATPGSLPGAVTNNGVNWTTGDNSVVGDFQATYGQGTGTALAGALQGLGTVNNTAIQGLIANTNLEANKQNANMQAGRAASGITANSSAAALGDADFYSSVNSNLQSEIGQMELHQQDTLIGSLTGEGTAHGTDGSTWDAVMNGITDVGNIAESAVKLAGALAI